MKVAVIGAGMAGISCADALQQAGYTPRVFDKGRGPGGRMSSKRAAEGYLDMGAQYFTVRHPAFLQQVTRWQQQGLVTQWQAPLYQYSAAGLVASPDQQARYIGQPAMHSPLKAQAANLAATYRCRITELQRKPEGWWLFSEQGEHFGPFAHVVLAIPSAQAAALLPAELDVTLPEHILTPCWAVNLQLSVATGHPAAGIFVKEAAHGVSWVSRQNSKAGRVSSEQWLVHFTPEFSQQHLSAEPLFWQTAAEQALSAILGQPLQSSEVISHRWLYAQQANTPAADFTLPVAPGLWVTGDWTRGGRVENAWLSGYELAKRIQDV